MSNNMWGDLSDLEPVQSPKAILQEQAQYLTQATDALLIGEVDSRAADAGKFHYYLDIRVPNLNDYIYTVLSIKHDLEIYPITVQSEKPQVSQECNDEERFRAVLKSILGSGEIKKILSRLISQAT